MLLNAKQFCPLFSWNSIYATIFKGQQSTLDIDLSNFPKGLYFVKFDDGTNSYKQKIIIE